MKQFLWTISLLLCFFGALYAQQGAAPKRLLHYHADKGANLDLGDSTEATQMVGNVKYYHNGAVITCDSAVLYADERAHFFGRVVLNQNASYVYGDRLEYDGATNMARMFAPIVKVVDEDAVLYTYNFTFNTLDNIGRYYGGGTLRQAENHMESREGFYYADDRLVIGVGDVEMRNPDYKMQSDSVAYDMDVEIARFFTKGKKTHIWTAKGEILRSLSGRYENLTSTYILRDEAYFYNGEEEMWADSVIYASDDESVWLYDDIQIRNAKNLAYIFGDYGQYWGDPQNAMVTRNPSVMRIDSEKNDSIFMRADTLFLYTFSSDILLHKAAEPEQVIAEGEELMMPASGRIAGASPEEIEKQQAREELDSLVGSTIIPQPGIDGGGILSPDSLSVAPTPTDSLLAEIPSAPLSKRELRQLAAEEKQKAKQAKAEARRQKQAEKDAKILAKRMEKMKARGQDILEAAPDSIAMADSLALLLPDSLAVEGDSLPVDTLPAAEPDSLQRVIKAYYNVKIWSTDMQAVCDSLIGFSADSTVHLYIKPVLWSGANQITAEVMDVYTRDGALDRAVFTGSPLMSSEVEVGAKYNQIKGLTMESFFLDNQIRKHDVISNAETLYYMQDEETGDYQGFLVAQASTMTFLLDSMQLEDIWLLTQIPYQLYPMDQIPESQPTELQGFSWQGDRRPVREDVFNRTIRDSELGIYDSMPQPRFPLTEKILTDRDNKIKQGVWVERNDRLTPETIEWIRSVDPDYGRDPDDEVRRVGNESIELSDEKAAGQRDALTELDQPADGEQSNSEAPAGTEAKLPEEIEVIDVIVEEQEPGGSEGIIEIIEEADEAVTADSLKSVISEETQE